MRCGCCRWAPHRGKGPSQLIHARRRTPSPIEVGRPRYLGPVDLSPARGRGRPLRSGVGLRSADCLVDCRRNGESTCPCRWLRSRGHSSYTRRFFVKVSRQRLRPASSSSFPDLSDLNEAKTLSLVKPGRRRRPYLMRQFADVADPIVWFENSRGN